MMGDDHRMAGRVAHRGIEAERAAAPPTSHSARLAAIGLVGGIGGDRLDAHEFEQALEAGIEVLVGAERTPERSSERSVIGVKSCL